MSSWVQSAAEEGVDPYVVDGGEVQSDYRIGVVEISTLPHKPSVQVLFIAYIDERALVAWPKSVWHRKTANRVIPSSWVSKMTAVEVVACLHYDRATALEESKMKIWIGFLDSEVASQVDFTLEDCGVEYTFEDGNVPFAQALADAANDHFSFFSASEHQVVAEGEVADGEEPGSPQVLSRVSRLEQMMEQVAANVAVLVSQQEPTTAAPRKSALRTSSSFVGPTAKSKSAWSRRHYKLVWILQCCSR